MLKVEPSWLAESYKGKRGGSLSENNNPYRKTAVLSRYGPNHLPRPLAGSARPRTPTFARPTDPSRKSSRVAEPLDLDCGSCILLLAPPTDGLRPPLRSQHVRLGREESTPTTVVPHPPPGAQGSTPFIIGPEGKPRPRLGTPETAVLGRGRRGKKFSRVAPVRTRPVRVPLSGRRVGGGHGVNRLLRLNKDGD